MRILTAFLLSVSLLPAAEKPNIVFILADDLGINDLGCYGRREHRTPNLDQLAKDGLRFTSAYAACPVCSPTRAAVLTGKNPARLHLTTFLAGRKDTASQMLLHPTIQQALPLEEVTLAERLKVYGYATACIGKWHLGKTAQEQGFDVVHAGKANTAPSADEGGKGEFDLTAKAVEFIKQNQEKPFFLYLAHNAPHIPLAARRDTVERFGSAFNPVYAGIINTLDESVGHILTTLDRLKLRDNTIVIFTSDNGGVHIPELKEDAPTHNTPYRAGKGFLYEGGIRIPLIIRYPAVIAPGKVTEASVISTDWVPTLLSLCGISTKDSFDGIDISPALREKDLPLRPLCWHFPHYTNQGSRPGGAVLEGHFKLIEHYEDGRTELFDLSTDPLEMHDLSQVLNGVTSTMKKTLAEWRESLKVQENAKNPAFDAAKHKAIYLDIDVSKVKAGKTAALTSEPLRTWRKLMDEAVKK